VPLDRNVMDSERNALDEGCINTYASSVPVWVIPTDEECVIALRTMEAIGLGLT
jgi:acetate kinase